MALAFVIVMAAVGPALATDTGHITGTVKNASEVGLPGIEVYVYDRGASWDWDYFRYVYTAADGSYDIGGLSTGRYRLRFWDDSRACLTEFYDNKPTLRWADDVAVTTGSTTSGINATLATSGHITGTVKNASDVGLAGIDVWVYGSDGSGGWEYLIHGHTIADGSYDIGVLDTGTYRLRFYDGSGTYANEYYDNKPTVGSADDVAVTAGSTTGGIDATLATPGHITGTVTDASAAGLAGIRVRAFRSNDYGGWDRLNRTTTAADGSYDLGGLDSGSYRLRFHDSSGTHLPEYYDDKPTLGWADDIEVTAGETTTGVNAMLATPGQITGKVTSGGVPVGGVYVGLSRKSAGDWSELGKNGFARTDASGQYRLTGLSPGAYRVGFQPAGGRYEEEFYNDQAKFRDADDIVIASDGALVTGVDADLSLTGSVSGTVTDGPGTPLQGVSVEVISESGGVSSTIDATTNSLGQYTAVGLDTGDYKVHFTHRNWGWVKLHRSEWYNDKDDRVSADPVHVLTGSDTFGIDAVLDPPSRIAGTVTDGTGAPLAGARVYLYDSRVTSRWNYIDRFTTNALGQYDWPVDDGQYKLWFTAVGSFRNDTPWADEWYDSAYDQAAATIVTVGRNTTVPDIDARLEAGGHVAGTVTNAVGDHVGGINVSAYRTDARNQWDYIGDTSTDSLGAYDLGRLGTGQYRVRFKDARGNYATEYYNDRPVRAAGDLVDVSVGATTSGIDAQLEGRASIGGTVADEHGAPLRGVAVAVYAPDGGGGWAYVEDTSSSSTSDWGGAYTDAQGRYRVSELVAGTYRVAFDPHRRPYVGEWYNGKADVGAADDVVVGTGAAVGGIDASLQIGGTISGTVADARGDPVYGISICAYDETQGEGAGYVSDATTSFAGVYTLDTLPTGSYLLTASDGYGSFFDQYYDGAGSWLTATPIAATVGGSTTGIDFTLHHPADIATLSSTSHPDQGASYPDTTPDMAWTPVNVALVDGYSWSVTANPGTIPDKTSDGLVTATTVGPLADGTWHFHLRGHSALGGWGPTAHYTLNIDTAAADSTPPTTTDDAPTAWQSTAVTVHLTATDNPGGSGMSGGLAKTEYKLDAAPNWSLGVSVAVSGDGVHTVTYRSTDAAGNKEAPDKSCTVNIDATAPATGDDTDSDWHQPPYSFNLTPTDSQSGVAATYWRRLNRSTVHSGTTVTLDGSEGKRHSGKQRIVYWSVDAAGNVEEPRTATVMIDGSPPYTRDHHKHRRHTDDITVQFKAYDKDSGVAHTYYCVDPIEDSISWSEGSQVTVLAAGNVGVHPIWYYSVDNVGNSEPVRVTWVLIAEGGGSP